jgi:hypothetical protein
VEGMQRIIHAMEIRNEEHIFIDRFYIRILGILGIGLLMPIIFYDGSEFTGLIRWILVSSILTLITWETSRQIVSFLWRKYPWEVNPLIHLLIITLFLLFLSALLGSIVYVLNQIFQDVSENYWARMKGVHLSISLLTFFTTSVYEGSFLFYKWKRALTNSALLEKENIKSQFETLKNQVNPHFLFNSLNTLSCIIPENPEKAVEYVNRFSSLYRHVLEMKDLSSVELREELELVHAYLYLQKIRFGDHLIFHMNIDSDKLGTQIMPLSVQVLIENAIKHNEISAAFPLRIDLHIENNYLVVKNSLKLTTHVIDSPKIGLKNLTARYALVSEKEPYFFQDGGEFVAGIPLLIDH